MLRIKTCCCKAWASIHGPWCLCASNLGMLWVTVAVMFVIRRQHITRGVHKVTKANDSGLEFVELLGMGLLKRRGMHSAHRA